MLLLWKLSCVEVEDGVFGCLCRDDVLNRGLFGGTSLGDIQVAGLEAIQLLVLNTCEGN